MRRSTPLAPGARVGLTTTIPVEVVLAAGLIPVDLNNLFIADPLALARVSQAEAAGFPRTLCAWIKGIYAALMAHPEIQAVIAACQGDCSNTQALGEILAAEGIEVIHFKFPYPRDREQLAREISALTARLGADPEAVARVQARLTPLRRQLRRLDRLTWETGQVTWPGEFPVAHLELGFCLGPYRLRTRPDGFPSGGGATSCRREWPGAPGVCRHPAHLHRPVALPGGTGRRRGFPRIPPAIQHAL